MATESVFKPKVSLQQENLEKKGPKILGDLEDDDRKVKAYESVLYRIARGEVTDPRVLEALFDPDPTYARVDDEEILIDRRDRSAILVGGRTVSRKETERNRVASPEQQQNLRDLLRTKNESIANRNASAAALNGLAYLARLIDTGDVDGRVLNAFFAPKFAEENVEFRSEKRTRLSLLQDPVTRRRLVVRNELTNMPIDAEKFETIRVTDKAQQTLLFELLNEKGDRVARKKATAASVKGLDYLTKQISSGQIRDPAVLERFFDRLYNNSNDPEKQFLDPVISDLDEQGRRLQSNRRRVPVEINGKPVSRKEAESVALGSKELKDLVRSFFNFINAFDLPTEIRQSLMQFAASPDQKGVDRFREIMPDDNPTLKIEVERWAADFEATRRRLGFENNFLKAADARSFRESENRLAEYEQRSPEDLQLVKELRGIALGERRLRTVRELDENGILKNGFKEDLGVALSIIFNRPVFYTPSGRFDIEKVLTSVEELEKSPERTDRNTARILTKAAYTAELAQFSAGAYGMLKPDLKPEILRAYIDGLPVRVSVDDIDYVSTVANTRDKVFGSAEEIFKTNRIDSAVAIRGMFRRNKPQRVFSFIDKFLGETVEDQKVKNELLNLYKAYVAAERPKDYNDLFQKEIEGRQQQLVASQFANPELGDNKNAFRYLRYRYYEVVHPLVESFRATGDTRSTIEEFVSNRAKFRQRIEVLEKQRPLTDIERAYFQSVQLLTLFNPYLIASAVADEGVTQEYLRHHFVELSKRTITDLDAERSVGKTPYVPILQVGFGPASITALGEIARLNPALASQTLVVDLGSEPGGPFSFPGGPAWELNSANSRGEEGYSLPDVSQPGDIAESRRIRGAYASPIRWFPGERIGDSETRSGSINTTVDYLPPPDSLSRARYPTNEEFGTILSLQGAMLANRAALRTRFIESRPNPDEDTPGAHIVTIEIEEADGSKRRMDVATDFILNGTGLGGADFGFELKGSRAEKVIEATKNSKKLKVKTTLPAFRALASRSEEPVILGETLIIYGGGNSADTLLEYVGNIFKGDNPRVRNVTKVYVITNKDLSDRPRYGALADLKPRDGRGNLIEFVSARVKDFDFVENKDKKEIPVEDRLIYCLDEKGQPIVDNNGKRIEADGLIAAPGFRRALNSGYGAYLKPGESLDGDIGTLRPTEKIKLPTNRDVSVGETLKGAPSIVLLGTAGQPDFNVEKLRQLPRTAREALQRNGAQNAVAVGFRMPEVQAAVNIILSGQEVTIDARPEISRRQIQIVSDSNLGKGEALEIPITIPETARGIPNNITEESRFLSPLLSYSLRKSINVATADGSGFTGELDFSLAINGGMIVLRYKDVPQNATDNISQELATAVANVCADPDFQRYAMSALQKKRRNQELNIVLLLKGGRIDAQGTFVER